MGTTIVETAVKRSFAAKGPAFSEVTAVVALPARFMAEGGIHSLVHLLKQDSMASLSPTTLASYAARSLGRYMDKAVRREGHGFALLDPDSPSLRDHRPLEQKVPEQLAKAYKSSMSNDVPVAIRYRSPVRTASGEVRLFPKLLVGKPVRDENAGTVTLETLYGPQTLSVKRIENITPVDSVVRDSLLYYRVAVTPGRRNRAVVTLARVTGVELRSTVVPANQEAAAAERAELHREATAAGLFQNQVEEVEPPATSTPQEDEAQTEAPEPAEGHFRLGPPRPGSLAWSELKEHFGKPVRIRRFEPNGKLRRELITELRIIHLEALNGDVTVGAGLTIIGQWEALEIVPLEEALTDA